MEFAELRLYQTPNLFELQKGIATITGVSKPIQDGWNSLNNLISNPSLGNARYNEPPVPSGADQCFKIDEALVSDGPPKNFVFTVDLGDSFFIHAFLLVQSFSISSRFGPYRIYIGADGTTYTNNAECNGGAFLDPADLSNLDSQYGFFFKLGKEIWCNLEGRYVTVVADLTSLSSIDYNELALCSFGLMGTKYQISSGSTIPNSISILEGQSTVITYPFITSKYTIGNTLAIKLRSSSPPSFINLNFAAETIRLNPSGVIWIGSHSLTIEQYDSNSSVKSTLRSDAIVIDVSARKPICDIGQTITQTIEDQLSFAQEFAIIQGSYAPASVTYTISSELQPYITTTCRTAGSDTYSSISFNLVSQAYADLLGQTSTIICTAYDSQSHLGEIRNLVITWVTKAPFFTSNLAASATFYTGADSIEQLPLISCCSDSANHSYKVSLSTTPVALEDEFSYDLTTSKLTWKGSSQTANSFSATSNMQLKISLERAYTNGMQTKTYSRSYSMAILVKDPTAPVIQDYNLKNFDIMTDVDQTLRTPAITEGTHAPAFADVTMNPELRPFISVALYANTTDSNNYINYAYAANQAVEALILVQDLSILVKLTDAKQVTHTAYNLPVSVNKVIPPNFSSKLHSRIDLVAGTAKQWVLPQPDASPYKMAEIYPITVQVPAQLSSYLTFDAKALTFFWNDDLTAQNFVDGAADYKVQIKLTNQRGDTGTYFQHLNLTAKVEDEKSVPYFDDFDFMQVFEVQVGNQITIKLPQPVDPDPDDTVTVQAILQSDQANWIAFDASSLTLTITPNSKQQAGLQRVQVLLSDGKDTQQYFIAVIVLVQEDYDPIKNQQENEKPDNREEKPILSEEKELDQQENDFESTSGDDRKGAFDATQTDLEPKIESKQPNSLQQDLDDYEDLGEKPTTARTNFDPMTLWRLKELKENLKKRREQKQPQFVDDQDVQELEPPQIANTKVNSYGEIVLSFDQDMLLEEVFSGFTFTSDIGEDQTDLRRHLDNFDLSSLVQAEINRGSDISAHYSMLSFDILIKGFEQQSITFKVEFKHPLSVSIGSKPDILKIRFVEPELFIAKKSGEPLDLSEREDIEMELPRQFPDQSVFMTVEAAGTAVQAASQAAMGFNIVLTIFLSVSLKSMWNMVHVTQLIIFLPLLLEWPPNSQLFVDQLSEAVELETITLMIYEIIIPKEYQYLLEDGDEDCWVNSSLLIGLGIFIVAFTVLIILVIYYCCLKQYRSRIKKDACQNQFQILKKFLFWDSFIRFLIESNLKICHEDIFFVHFCASFETQAQGTNTGIRIFFVILVGLFMIWSALFIICRKKQLQQEEVKEKYESMYDGIKTDKLKSALYTTVFCTRRLTLVLILLVMQEREPLILIYLYLLIFTLNFIYLKSAQANTEEFLNKLELFNEVGLMILLYTMFFFLKEIQLDTFFVWDVGTSMIGVLSVMFLINFSYMLFTSISKLCKKSKAKYQKHLIEKQKRLQKYQQRVTRMTELPQPLERVQKQVNTEPEIKNLPTGFNLIQEMSFVHSRNVSLEITQEKPSQTQEDLQLKQEPKLLSGKDAEDKHVKPTVPFKLSQHKRNVKGLELPRLQIESESAVPEFQEEQPAAIWQIELELMQQESSLRQKPQNQAGTTQVTENVLYMESIRSEEHDVTFRSAGSDIMEIYLEEQNTQIKKPPMLGPNPKP